MECTVEIQSRVFTSHRISATVQTAKHRREGETETKPTFSAVVACNA